MPPVNQTTQTALREYLRSVRIEGYPPFNYSPHVEELRKMDYFFKRSSGCFFVADMQTSKYMFISDVVDEVMGHRYEAVMEGGMEYVDYHIQSPDHISRKAMQEQFTFFTEHKNTELSEIRLKFVIPWLDQHKKQRYFFQQYNISHRSNQGFPLGFYGFCMDFTNIIKESQVRQHLEVFNKETNQWEDQSRLEFYLQIDDNKLLSKREIEILKWVAEGLSSKEIAEKLFISTHTVNTHRKNMLARTNSKNSADLILYGVQNKLL